MAVTGAARKKNPRTKMGHERVAVCKAIRQGRFAEEMVRCDVSDPPSKQAFVEELERGTIAPWYLYHGVMEFEDLERIKHVERACPDDVP